MYAKHEDISRLNTVIDDVVVIYQMTVCQSRHWNVANIVNPGGTSESLLPIENSMQVR